MKKTIKETTKQTFEKIIEKYDVRIAFIALTVVILTCVAYLGCVVHAQYNQLENKLEQAEKTIEGYEQEISEYTNLLDMKVHENNELSKTVADLRNILESVENELATTKNELDSLKEEHSHCRAPITYSFDNALIPSNVTGDELYRGLLGGLKNYAWYFVEMEEKYGVNAIFLASIAALESGWCSTEVAINNNNLFGYKNYSGEGFRVFSSKEESINTVAKRLKSSYLTEGGKYYCGLSVADVNVNYCEQSDWAEKVDSVARGIVDRINNV